MTAVTLAGDEAALTASLLRIAGQLPDSLVHTLHHQDGRAFVQVGPDPTRTAADAIRLLLASGATWDVGHAAEPEGPEMSGHAPAGTWVYIPITDGRGATKEETPR